MRKVVMVTIATVLFAGLGHAGSFDTGYEPLGLDELGREKGIFKTTLVHPDADFSRYTKILIEPVVLVIDTSGAAINEFSTGRLFTKRERETIVPEFDEVVEFKRIVGDILATDIARGTDLGLIDQAGPGTLILRPVVTDVEISPSSKIKSEDGRGLPELDEATIVFDLIDSDSGRILARLAENLRCKAPKGVDPEHGPWSKLPSWAEHAAADLVRELERVRSGFEGAGSDST